MKLLHKDIVVTRQVRVLARWWVGCSRLKVQRLWSRT